MSIWVDDARSVEERSSETFSDGLSSFFTGISQIPVYPALQPVACFFQSTRSFKSVLKCAPMLCRLAYAAWATARLHSSRLRFSYSDAVCGSVWFCFQSRSWAMARRRPVSLRRMPRWRWLNACRAGRLNALWMPSEKMPVSVEGFSDDLWGGAVWNACPSAMVWAASLAVTTHSSKELLARRLAPCRPVQAVSPKA